ncbi:MAG TPA: hypothetical protein VFC63_12570 [Blastocatellia bacterium]|nr:hypothetical protein [Blastocatellia bacterium]
MKNISVRRLVSVIAVACCLVSSLVVAVGQSPDTAHTPEKGSAERKAIMDALREDFKKANDQQVVFQVNYLKVHNGWAWTDTTPLDAKGKPVAEGGTSLLHNVSGTWQVIDLSTISEDPDNPMGQEEASPGFVKNLRKKYPDVPLDIFPKRKK